MGVPATANRWLFRDVLRKEFGFDGVVISDWGAVKEIIAHGAAEDEKQAAELAIKAGVDIEMMTTLLQRLFERIDRRRRCCGKSYWMKQYCGS